MYCLLLEAKTKSTSVQEVGDGFSGSVNGSPVRQALNLVTDTESHRRPARVIIPVTVHVTSN